MRQTLVRLCVVLILLLAPSTGLWSQSEVFSACVFPTTPLGSDPQVGEFSAIIEQALAQNLRHLGVEVLPPEAWQNALADRDRTTADLINGPLATVVARTAGARMAVSSLCYVDGRELVMSVKVLDTRTGRLVTSVYTNSLVGVTIHNRITAAIDQLTPELESFMQPRQEVTDVAPFVIEATLLSADEGMAVALGDEEPIGNIQDGVLVLPFSLYPVGTSLVLNKSLEGYHPDTEIVVLDETNSKVALEPMWRETQRSLHLNWTTGQIFGLGVGYRHYLKPDWLFLQGEDYFYLQLSPYPDGRAVIHNDITATIGRYVLLPHDSRFRMAVSTGLGVILTKSDVPGLFTDWYLNLGNLSFEWNWRDYIAYARFDGKLTTGLGNDALGVQLMRMQRFGPLVTFGVGRKQ